MDSQAIESLIQDLAFILILGAATTVFFKWIKQPVVLGYIVAGFLASPNFTYLPSVTTEANIDFWAQIGIVILLFSLGLEFSFKKLLNAGGSALITALIIVVGMMGSGFAIGHLLGFTHIDSLFLGGMLSMSSTTIIIKAFNDLGLSHKKFASQVFAVLIVEDLFAVLMMVILSSIAINKSVEGTQLLFSISKLIFFLVIWFAVGVFILPTLLNRIRRFLNSETVLIVSMGLCLGMAVFSVACGFSLALGAFVMGSILAGTSFAEKIHHVTIPVKDLFGSVFFISVGMMVNPAIIAEYWGPILIISGVVIVGMIIFGTSGMLLTGQTLRTAIESGFSLTQIGEFAFIIASLGMSLGVLDNTIYPIVVAVSVLTTFTTPYFIKMSGPVYNAVERHLPRKLHFLINRYTTEATAGSAIKGIWMSVLKRYIWRILLYSTILITICMLAGSYLLPLCIRIFPTWGKLICAILSLAFMSPFLLSLSYPTMRRTERKQLLEANWRYNMPLMIMSILRILITLNFVIYILAAIYSLTTGIIGGIVFLLLTIFVFSKHLRKRMNRIETRFLDNLNERELRRSGRNNNIISNLHLAGMTVSYDCPFVGERLGDSQLRSNYGVNVAAIQRGDQLIAVPGGSIRIFPGDILSIIGTDEQIQRLLPVVEARSTAPSDASGSDHTMKLTSIELSAGSPLVGLTVAESRIREDYKALLVSIMRQNDYISPEGNTRFRDSDILWLVGNPRTLAALK